ncbi:DeoR family transcriptional regulator [Erysipelotrichaceae bacterium]|nr:DeoR family transcriptional regulator [Erysipelotrichaceae bacterium]
MQNPPEYLLSQGGHEVDRFKVKVGVTMKKSLALVFKRRENILEELKKNGSVDIQEIAAKLGVSPLTIRRDLALFEKKNIIKKSYGKATYLNNVSSPNRDTLFLSGKSDIIIEHKKKIAKFARQFVRAGMTIYVNSGVIALLFIQEISYLPVTIFTNNLLICTTILGSDATIFLIGGEIHNDTSIIGDIAIQNLKMQYADICFLEADAVDEKIVSSYSLSETLVNRTMIEYTSGKKIIMVEAKNVGTQKNFMTIHTKMITDFITNQTVNKVAYHRIKELKVNMFFV